VRSAFRVLARSEAKRAREAIARAAAGRLPSCDYPRFPSLARARARTGRDNRHCGGVLCFPLYTLAVVGGALLAGCCIGAGWRRCLSRCAAGRRALALEAAANRAMSSSSSGPSPGAPPALTAAAAAAAARAAPATRSGAFGSSGGGGSGGGGGRAGTALAAAWRAGNFGTVGRALSMNQGGGAGGAGASGAAGAGMGAGAGGGAGAGSGGGIGGGVAGHPSASGVHARRVRLASEDRLKTA
jgi:hypothetical protein